MAFVRAATVWLSTISLAAQEPRQYLCIADSITGFAFEKGRWLPTIFKPEGRWIVHSAAVGGAPFGVKAVGQEVDIFVCVDGFDSEGDMICRPTVDVLSRNEPLLKTGGTFNMSRQSGRFLLTNTVGYWRNASARGDTSELGGSSPHIAIGKCSAF